MKAKNVVENTTLTARHNPVSRAILSTPDGIVASEKRGQEQFVKSEVLPTKINGPGDGRTGRTILEAWGFVFGAPVPGDPLFQQAKLPPGWTKKGSGHDMWSYVLDDQGRERCSIFYKAAFYDRGAFLSIMSRYQVDVEFEDKPLRQKGRMRGLVKGDTGKVLFTGEWRGKKNADVADWAAYDQASKDARAWYVENLPADIVEQWALP